LNEEPNRQEFSRMGWKAKGEKVKWKPYRLYSNKSSTYTVVKRGEARKKEEKVETKIFLSTPAQTPGPESIKTTKSRS
jgi:hypothetical protein